MADKMPMPFSNPYTYAGHGGVDFPQAEWTPIPAITDGLITYAGWWNDRAGFTKTITRRDGLQIMHCHLPDLSGLRVGRRVTIGQEFAFVGNTGRSTGPHLHLEMWLRGVPQNEWDWMDRNNWIGKTPAPKPPAPTPGPTPNPPEEDDIMNPRQIHYRESNGSLIRALIVPGTGYFVKWTESGATYANGIARNMETGSSTELTRSLFQVFEREAAALRPKDALSIELAEA